MAVFDHFERKLRLAPPEQAVIFPIPPCLKITLPKASIPNTVPFDGNVEAVSKVESISPPVFGTNVDAISNLLSGEVVPIPTFVPLS